MATAQQGRKFTDAEAERFAKFMAGFDTGNASNEEAAINGQKMRGMAAEKKIRLCDAWELPEIRVAVDRQSQPVRAVLKVVKEVQIVNEGCTCEPWPVQMFWFFVGLAAWIVKGVFGVIKQVGLFVIEVAEEMQRRKACRNG